MKLGIYYHVPAITVSTGDIGLPAYFGKFIDSLARTVTHLYCFFHTMPAPYQDAEYWCKEKNITLISLYKDKPAYIKAFLPFLFFNSQARNAICACDAIIVRGPSPLAPYFQKFKKKTFVVNLLVGSYLEGAKHIKLPFYKEWAVKLLVYYMHHQTIRSIKNEFVLVNSKQLELEYAIHARKIEQIFTTTLTDEDFDFKDDTCQGEIIRLLYTGRLDWAKGLKELMDAFISLQKEFGNFELHFVGWEDYKHKPVEESLIKKAMNMGIHNYVFFHGKKTVGPDLFQFYRSCDIFILPSYHEGFPRTIWEALANSIPVISTSVGGIPHILTNEESALLIKPRDIEGLRNSILRILNDVNLRKKIIYSGHLLASKMKLDSQNERIIQIIKKEMENED